MTDEFDRLLWAYRAVFKQTDVGGGIIVVNIVMNERTVILWGAIGANDYAANRTVLVNLFDEGDNSIGRILFNTTVDNQFIIFPWSDISAITANDGPKFDRRIVLGKSDYVQASTNALVQNEELTVLIRALISQAPPTVTTTGSGGTVTTTVTYDKVM